LGRPLLVGSDWPKGLALAGLIFVSFLGLVAALYGLLSLFVNKAVFTQDSLYYRTLFQRFEVNYTDITLVELSRAQVTWRGFLSSRRHYRYKLITRKGVFELDSFEFFGLTKQLDALARTIEKG
jgi:hypothetical protein